MNRKNKGFTLAELLIVVAIIAVLVAISIPIFTSQLEKSREATDLANVRAAYAQVMTAANVGDKGSAYYDQLTKEYKTIVYLNQKVDGWTTQGVLNVGGISSDDDAHWKGTVMGEGKCEVAYNTESHETTLTWNGLTLRVDYHWRIDGDKLSASAGSNDNQQWPCNAITDFLQATNGTSQTLTTAAITDACTNLQKGIKDGYTYQIGFFIVDKDNNIIVDSGRRSITSSKIQYSLNVSDYIGEIDPTDPGKNVYRYNKPELSTDATIKIAVQVFKVKDNASEKMSMAEARELEKLISVENVSAS